MKVGTVFTSLTVPAVSPTGPNPKTPSTPWKPLEREAFPNDWFRTVTFPYFTWRNDGC